MRQYADLDESEARHATVAPLTSPGRTIEACIAKRFEPELVHYAVDQARRGD